MKYTFYLFVFLCNTQFVTTWRSFTFRFSAIQCTKRSQLISYINCSIPQPTGPRDGLSLSLKFSTAIVNPYLDLIVTATRSSQSEFVIVNITQFDGCKFLQNSNRFNLLKILRNEFEKFAKMPNKCPVAKGTEIHVKNMSLDPERFPPYVPQTGFKTEVRLWEKYMPLFNLNVIGRVDMKKRITKQQSNK
ncbi:uncharacterized protein LOC120782518 [Bactrocera tryoni]|uniref:uncharacterized protein LOC120782518 n=1 Tax=Bactrocera tryoni TaxID=59916 RepID=UPI001A957CBA|nr:uncharacterized protein LOC120782518 [Bactrocera tryoni]